MRLERWSLFLAVMAAACGPPGDTDALLLLDADARAAGLELSLGGWVGSPLLPIAAREHEEVVISGGFGTRAVAVRPGYLGLVIGSGGSIDWRRIGDEVDGDALELAGEADAVRAVATTLGAALTRDGLSAWRLRGPDLLSRSAWMTAGDGLERVSAVPLTQVRPLELAAFPIVQSRVVLLSEVMSFVGVYSSDRETLVLDASGGFMLGAGCDRTVGTFRVEGGAVVLMPEHGAPLQLRVAGDVLEGHARFTPFEEAP